MKWNEDYFRIHWAEISNRAEKEAAANTVAALAKNGDVIGFGSGSTSYLAVLALGRRVREEKLDILALPTSREIRLVCGELGIPVATLDDARPDWGFDGADEVSPERWLIKGRGGAMFQEKLVISNSPKTYILVDHSKFVDRLCTRFPIPVECVQSAYKSVATRLYDLGAAEVALRPAGTSKDGPVITENDNFILDASFPNVTAALEHDIKNIVGVLESGLFIGYPVETVCC